MSRRQRDRQTAPIETAPAVPRARRVARLPAGAAALAAVLTLALALRVWGLTWGLPNQDRLLSYHPDEGPNLVQGLLDEGRARPHLSLGFYNYGGLYFYLWQGAAAINQSYGLVALPPTGEPHKPAPDSPAALILVGRWLTVLMGALTVWAVYALGLHAFGRRAGLAAAFLYAVTPAAVVHGHYATVDVPATLFVTLALVFAAKAGQVESRVQSPESRARSGHWSLVTRHWPLIAAGALSGLAAATKYNCGIVLLAPLAAAWLARRDAGWRWWAIPAVVGAGIAGFVVGCPGVALDWSRFWRDFGFELAKSRQGMGALFADTGNGWLYHLVVSLRLALTTPLLLLCLAGVAYALVRRSRQGWVLLTFLVAYYLVIGWAQVRFLRYVIPLLPVLAVLAARLAVERWPQRAVRRAMPALAGAAALCALGTACAMNHLFAVPDARDRALAYVQQAAAQGSAIAFATVPWYYTPPLSPGFTVFAPTQRRQAAAGVQRYTLRLPAEDAEWDMSVFAPPPPACVLLSDVESEDAVRLRMSSAQPFLAELEAHYARRDFQNLPTVAGISLPKPAWVPNDWLYTWPRESVYTLRP